MAGSIHDVDDLMQDAMLRAWRGLASFQQRSSLRTWLYKVTASACLDALDKKAVRQRPSDLGPPGGGDFAMRQEPVWIEPCPDELVDVAPSPEARYTSHESVSLAFLALLQHLPPKQRVVVVLRDVLGWEAAECAELLDTSVASVTSALQRGRETLAARADAVRAPAPPTAPIAELLERYVRAWESVDVQALVALLGEDAALTMPPITTWLVGREAIGASLAGMILTPAARGNLELVPTTANGRPAFAAYQRDETGVLQASALQLLTIDGDQIIAIDAFLDPSLFACFGLPMQLA